MLFNSQPFLLLFLPAVLALYYAVAAQRVGRQLVLVGGSLAFYAAWDWRFLPLLLAIAVATWLLARGFLATGQRAFLWLGVALNLGALAVFKYANFLAANLAALAGLHHVSWPIVLPLGLSFFVFSKIGYLVDLGRGRRCRYGLLDFLEFVTFFPQLIAGPLTRHGEIIPQFARDPRGADTAENVSRGLALFAIGLAKKVVIADGVAVDADAMFTLAATGGALGAEGGWIAALCYALQIYFDFSGYSDMAIGLAMMFGLRLPLNFAAPYRAVSVRDFWRRWHMTLSRFLRDYVYIPLGGNRRGTPRVVANLLATMLLAGLWHGAAWHFVAWGGVHGAGLAANHLWARAGWRLPRALAWAATMLFVVCAWVLFRAPDFASAGRVFAAMAGAGGLGHVHLRNAVLVAVAAVTAVAGPTSQVVALERLQPHAALAVPAAVALTLLLLLVGGRVPAEFVYFRF